MTREHEKLQHSINYKGSWVVVISDNFKLKIAQIDNVVFRPEDNKQLKLENAYHVLGKEKIFSSSHN